MASGQSVIGKNIVWLFLSQIATWMISIVLLVIAPARFGDEDYGKITFAVSYMSFFTLLGMLGTASFIVRSVARDHALVGPYIVNGLALKIVLGIVLSALALGSGLAFGYDSETITMLAFGCGTMLFALLNDTLVAGLSGMERMARPAFWGVVQVYVANTAALIVVLRGGGVVAYASVFMFAALVPVLANLRLLWPHVRHHLRLDLTVWRVIALGGLPLLALSGLNMIYGSIDIPILKAISGNSAVGWYGIAYRWVTMPVFIASIVVTAFLPSLSNLAVQSQEAFASLTNRALRLVAFVSIPASMGIALTSREFLVLIYDQEYIRSVPLVQILAIHIPLAAMDTVLATALIAADRQRKYLIIAGTAAVLNPPLNVLMIRLADRHFENGAIGAAIMTVATEVFIMAGALYFRSKGVMDRQTVGYISRCLGAAIAMVPSVWLVRSGGLLAMASCGFVTYAIAAYLLRTIDVAEVKRMATRLRRGQAEELPAEADH